MEKLSPALAVILPSVNKKSLDNIGHNIFQDISH